jgi:SAM-dependent methyltransferase
MGSIVRVNLIFNLNSMFDRQQTELQQTIKALVSEAIDRENPSGWFEPLYAKAGGDSTQVPWAKNRAHPYLEDWLVTYPPQAKGNSALVTGCGLGDDAELLAHFGYRVTAFDIAPTAIAWCKQRFPNSSVNYLVADLMALDPGWQKQFDLVYECRNIQALPLNVRTGVVRSIASLVVDRGTLLIITRHRDNDTIPEGPPWALSDTELSQFAALGLSEVRRDRFWEGDEIKIEHLRLELKSCKLT